MDPDDQNPHSESVVVESYTNNSVQELAFTQEQLTEIKKSLNELTDIFVINKSLVTKASDYWSKLAIWQKIAGGVICTAPTLIMSGLLVNVGALLILSGAISVVYTTSGIVLDDHHANNTVIVNQLKEGISSLANILTTIISELDRIRSGLAQEVKKFKTENERLAQNIDSLETNVNDLTDHIEVFKKTEDVLRKEQEQLEKQAEELKKTSHENQQLFEKTQRELLGVKRDHEKSQLQLQEKVEELAKTNLLLELELTKAQAVSLELQNTVTLLSNTAITDAKKRELFQKRIENIISNTEEKGNEFIEKLIKLEQELSQVNQELQTCTERYKNSLITQEKSMAIVESLAKQAHSNQKSSGLAKHGLYALPQKIGSFDLEISRPLQLN